MSTTVALGALTVWAAVYEALGGFFIIAGRGAARRQFLTLGGAFAAAGGACMAEAFSEVFDTGLGALLARVALGLTILAAASLHFDYVTQVVAPRSRRLALVTHALGGVIALAAVFGGIRLVATAPVLDELRVPQVCPVTVVVGGYVLITLLGTAGLLGLAIARGQRGILIQLIALVGVIAVVLHDFVGGVIAPPPPIFPVVATPYVLWVYALMLVEGMWRRSWGAEGRLREAASNLKARTEELRRSHLELEKIQEELIRKEQLAAVGELAASIAHEVRNPLAVIVNATSGLRRATLSPDDRRTLLDIIDEETERLNRLVTELLRFARPVNAKASLVSLPDMFDQVARGVPASVAIEFVWEDDEGLRTVWADPGLFRLAFDNLVSNAVQAMREGGVITIEVHHGTFEEGDPAVAISVRDTGHGMDPSIVERSTKPFFTTRPSGTGLGLPIVQRIIEAHGGTLEIESQLGEGTTVTVLLPRGDSPRPSERFSRLPRSRPPEGGSTNASSFARASGSMKASDVAPAGTTSAGARGVVIQGDAE